MNIAWFIVLTIAVIYFQSYIYTKYGFNNLRYTRVFNKKTAYPHEEVELVDTFINKKILPIPWVRVESKLNRHFTKATEKEPRTEEHFHRSLFSLFSYQKIVRRHYMVAHKRGVYRLQSIALTLGDMLGFSDSYRSHETNAELVVYPSILRHKELPTDVQQFLGDLSVKQWIIDDPFLKIGTREWTPSDPSHRINWKKTAQTTKLQVNEHDHTRELDLLICLDADQSDDIWMPINDMALYEQSISLTASLFFQLKQMNVPYGFLTNAVSLHDVQSKIKPQVEVKKGTGERHYRKSLLALSHLVEERSRNFHYLLEDLLTTTDSHLDIVVISPMKTTTMSSRVAKLRQAGHNVTVLPVVLGGVKR